MRPLKFRPFFDRDAEAAARWYDEECTGSGQEFVRELNESIARLAAAPESFPTVGRGYRVCRLHRFQYGIYFRIAPQDIVIIGVIHLHRSDRIWRTRTD